MSKDYTLRATFTAVDKITGPMSRINKSIAGLHKSIDGVKAANAGLGQAMLPIAAITAGVGAFAAKSVTGFLDTAGAIKDMSDRVGLTAEQLQEWLYVAEKSGVGAESFQGAMEKLNKTIFDAASGKNQSAAELFSKMGVSLRGANGELAKAADVLPKMAGAFAGTENPTLRTAMAMQLMGKSGGAMIGVLSQGSDAIRQQQEEARSLGLIMSNASIDRADNFADGPLAKMNKQITAMQMNIGDKLLPVLDKLASKMSDWLSANHEQVANNIAKAADGLGTALSKIDWENVATWAKVIFGAAMLSQIASVTSAVILCSKAYGGLAIAMLSTSKAAFVSAFEGFAMLTGKMIASNAAGVALTGTMLRLAAAIGGPLMAAWAGWKLGGLINDNVINPAVRALSGQKDATLGTWLYDKLNPGADSHITQSSPLRSSGAPSLLAANGQRLQGSADINIKIDGLPVGSRVEAGGKGIPGISINPDVGYRSMAW